MLLGGGIDEEGPLARHVIAATQVRGSDRPQTVTTVIDEKTGLSQSFVKTDPYPWLGFQQHSEIRMSYGYRYDFKTAPFGEQNTKRVGRLSLTHDFAQVKALNFGVRADVDTDGRAFAGVGLGYRW